MHKMEFFAQPRYSQQIIGSAWVKKNKNLGLGLDLALTSAKSHVVRGQLP